MTHFYERLIGKNQYPSNEFEETMEKFIDRMDAISRQLTRYLALSLELEETYFDYMFAEQPNMQMKICKYPIAIDGGFNRPLASVRTRTPVSCLYFCKTMWEVYKSKLKKTRGLMRHQSRATLSSTLGKCYKS